MDNFFHDFLDTLPIFLCVADNETKMPIYYNKIAEECIGNMPEDKKVAFVRDVVENDSLIKFCEIEESQGRWFQMESQPCKWLNDQNCILIIGCDCSKSITNEELLTVAAYTDPLTGIYNRKIGFEMLTKFINELKIGSPAFTICFFDLDDLKYVNDKHGHSAGDHYLMAVSNLVKQTIRQTDVFARLGGDEFLIIFPKCPFKVAKSIIEEISKMLIPINSNNDPRTYYSISYGVLEVGPDNSHSMNELLDMAGAMMYEMKSKYKSTRVLPD